MRKKTNMNIREAVNFTFEVVSNDGQRVVFHCLNPDCSCELSSQVNSDVGCYRASDNGTKYSFPIRIAGENRVGDLVPLMMQFADLVIEDGTPITCPVFAAVGYAV